MGDELLLGLAAANGAVAGVLAVVVFVLARALTHAGNRHAAQIDRLLVLQKSESLAEFAAASSRLDKARLEEARGAAPSPEPRGVAAPKRTVSNLFARYRKPQTTKE